MNMKSLSKDLLMITVGSLCYALALTILAIPNELTEGGITSAAIILHYAFGWSHVIVAFILASVILIAVFKFLTKRAVVVSVLTVLMVSFFIYITEDKVESLGDPLVSTVFAGFFIGVGCGLIFRTGSSMGGTSLIAIMFNKLFGWDMVRAIFIMDVMIVLSGF